MTAALVALENEARENPDAARLLAIIENMPYYERAWGLLELLNHYICEGPIRSRPMIMSVLLRELSAAFPVPLSMLN
jgi:hypothetical protein